MLQLILDQMVFFWVCYQFLVGIFVGVGVCYIGKQWVDDVNIVWLLLVMLMDVMMWVDFGVWLLMLKGVYVQVNVNNIGDCEYIFGCYGIGNCYWGVECSVIVIVGYDF